MQTTIWPLPLVDNHHWTDRRPSNLYRLTLRHWECIPWGRCRDNPEDSQEHSRGDTRDRRNSTRNPPRAECLRDRPLPANRANRRSPRVETWRRQTTRFCVSSSKMSGCEGGEIRLELWFGILQLPSRTVRDPKGRPCREGHFVHRDRYRDGGKRSCVDATLEHSMNVKRLPYHISELRTGQVSDKGDTHICCL